MIPRYSSKNTACGVYARSVDEDSEESGNEVCGCDDEDVVELFVLEGLVYGVAGCYENEAQEGYVEEVEDGSVEDVEEPGSGVGRWLGGRVIDALGFRHYVRS